MQAIEYGWYVEAFHGGSVDSRAWAECEQRARQKMEYYQRVYTIIPAAEDSIKFAICGMAESLHAFDELERTGAGSSVRIGSVSSSTAEKNLPDTSPAAVEADLLRCLRLHCDVYRGCGY